MRLFSDVASRVDDPHLRRAFSLAVSARGRTWPNPTVGCVIVSDGRVVGEGHHPRAGQPHAEVFALAAAGERARGATAFVTLEPCAHHGKTPPCTRALIAAGVGRVIIGMRDPNRDAAGGAAILSAAGIEVDFAPDDGPFAQLNAGWLKRLATGLPRAVVKCGLSLDGRPGFSAGERAAITGSCGLEVTRRLREVADAVLVSASTVKADDPALTVRDGDGVLGEHQPLRVVLVRDTLPPLDARLFTDGAAPTLALVADSADGAWRAALPDHVSVAEYAAADGLAGALRALGTHGVGDVLIEPGPRLFSALWFEDLVDELVTVTAGGMAGAGMDLYVGTPDRSRDSLVHRFSPSEAGIVGDVSVTVWNRLAGFDDQ